MPLLTAPEIRTELTKAFGTPTRVGAVEAFSRLFYNFIQFFLTDAPSDGSTYGRQDGEWVVVSGSGSSVHAALAALNFGDDFTHYGEVFVSATWVVSGMQTSITVSPLAITDNAMEIAVLSFQPVVSAITDGVGFTLSVFTPVEAKGVYYFSCVGV